MPARQYQRGHEIYYNESKQEWLYTDDDTSASIERPCKRCGHLPLPTGEDYCLGHIDGAEHACCGHGVTRKYVIMRNNDGGEKE